MAVRDAWEHFCLWAWQKCVSYLIHGQFQWDEDQSDLASQGRSRTKRPILCMDMDMDLVAQ